MGIENLAIGIVFLSKKMNDIIPSPRSILRHTPDGTRDPHPTNPIPTDIRGESPP
jgi:hypothetical protein